MKIKSYKKGYTNYFLSIKFNLSKIVGTKLVVFNFSDIKDYRECSISRRPPWFTNFFLCILHITTIITLH